MPKKKRKKSSMASILKHLCKKEGFKIINELLPTREFEQILKALKEARTIQWHRKDRSL